MQSRRLCLLLFRLTSRQRGKIKFRGGCHRQLCRARVVSRSGRRGLRECAVVSRRCFDNYAEQEVLCGDDSGTVPELELPCLKSHRQLPQAIRERLGELAASSGTCRRRAAFVYRSAGFSARGAGWGGSVLLAQFQVTLSSRRQSLREPHAAVARPWRTCAGECVAWPEFTTIATRAGASTAARRDFIGSQTGSRPLVREPGRFCRQRRLGH